MGSNDPATIDAAWEAENRRVTQAYADEMMRKMPALFRHYGLDEGDYRGLAIKLAIDNVPGFAWAKARPGAPTVWNEVNVALLRLHIDVTKEHNPKLSFAEAARRVAKSNVWASLLRNPDPIRAKRCDAAR